MINKITVGIDEVGRGCWAGPLVVGAVILNKEIGGLADSKILSAAQREVLSLLIQKNSTACSLGWVWPDEIDELGLSKSMTLAIDRALIDIIDYDEIIIDGSVNYLKHNPKAKTIIKADSTVPSVSAASIIAKVARDKYMADQSVSYPLYGFEFHVGYGTSKHVKAILDHGITPLHRKSFKPIKNYISGMN